MTKRDYYEVLGIEKDAGEQQIKTAYRKLAIKHHPDKNAGDKAAEEKFKEAAEAYSILSNLEKRARYDQFGHASLGSRAGGFGGFDPDVFGDFSDILGDFFGFGDIFGRGRQRGAQRGADLRYDLRIGFEEAVFGVKTRIKIPREETCQTCDGSGADPGVGTSICKNCHGQGQVRYQQGFFTISRTCSHCQGSGRIISHPCPNCRGNGRLRKEKVLSIRIPAGVDESSRMRVSGEGESGVNGGPSGDLYVIISVEEHPFFKRHEDNNISCEVPITFSQAALGDAITVPTLGGEESIRVPEGTQSGTVFRLKSKGVASLSGQGKGDQLVTVTVVTPTKLTQEKRELFQRLSSISGEETQSSGGLFEKVREILG